MDSAYYAKRAMAAYAAAEAATDPRDKAAYRGAAQTWERLAHPNKATYSLEPERRDLAALKTNCAIKVCPLCGSSCKEGCAENDCDNDWTDFWTAPLTQTPVAPQQPAAQPPTRSTRSFDALLARANATIDF